MKICSKYGLPFVEINRLVCAKTRRVLIHGYRESQGVVQQLAAKI